MSETLPVVPRPVRYAAVVACAVLIAVASVLDPGEGVPSTLLGLPITVSLHLLGYAGLTAAVGYARLAADGRALAVAVGVAVLFGATVELAQGPLPHRTASAVDGLVNAAGAVVGAALWRAVAPRFGAGGAYRDGQTTSL